MNLWHDIAPARVRPEDFFAVIEIEKGSKNKYEMDKETGALRLDRILYTSTHYPANYGFIPRTWADDGDPLDVLVLCSECIRPLSLVECYPIGVISMEDSGSLDEKIIAIPFQDPTYNTYQNTGLPPTPIANPGLASIKATLSPASTKALYYALDSESGTHKFFTSYGEFQAFVAKQSYSQ